jgi:hypothetical protein
MKLLELSRHFSGSSGGPKYDRKQKVNQNSLDMNRYVKDDGTVKSYEDSDPYNWKDVARTASGVASRNIKAVGQFADSLLPIPVGSAIGDLLGDTINNYGKGLSDRTYVSKDRASNALLSFLDGEDRPGNVNKYTDFVGKLMSDPKKVTKALTWAQNFTKNPMPAKALSHLMNFGDAGKKFIRSEEQDWMEALHLLPYKEHRSYKNNIIQPVMPPRISAWQDTPGYKSPDIQQSLRKAKFDSNRHKPEYQSPSVPKSSKRYSDGSPVSKLNYHSGSTGFTPEKFNTPKTVFEIQKQQQVSPVFTPQKFNKPKTVFEIQKKQQVTPYHPQRAYKQYKHTDGVPGWSSYNVPRPYSPRRPVYIDTRWGPTVSDLGGVD